MANSYIQGANALLIPSDRTREVLELVCEVIAKIEEKNDSACPTCPYEVWDVGLFRTESLDPKHDPDYVPGMVRLVLYHEESCTPESHVHIFQKVMKRLRLEGPIVMSWAYICDSARVGAFGGISCVVTPTSCLWQSSASHKRAIPSSSPRQGKGRERYEEIMQWIVQADVLRVDSSQYIYRWETEPDESEELALVITWVDDDGQTFVCNISRAEMSKATPCDGAPNKVQIRDVEGLPTTLEMFRLQPLPAHESPNL